MADTITRAKTLHLGVLVQPYRNGRITTGDVAEILEDKYGIFAAFYRVHKQDVMDAVENSIGGALESLIMGGTVGDPFDSAMNAIEQEMKDFLSSREVETVGIPNVPTQAALRGVNHRLAHPYAKGNPRRQSFIDSSLFQTSMKAWID